MAVNPRVKGYLDEKGVSYEPISHSKVFSTIEEARALGIEADEIGKTLIIKIKGEKALLVVPGAHRIDSRKIRHIFGNKHARLASEEEMAQDFPEFELGAVPPLGALLGLPVYIDRRLFDHEIIIFTAGTHTDSIKMRFHDFVNLVEPEIVDAVEELVA